MACNLVLVVLNNYNNTAAGGGGGEGGLAVALIAGSPGCGLSIPALALQGPLAVG